MPYIYNEYKKNVYNHLEYPTISEEEVTVITNPNQQPPPGVSLENWHPARSINHTKFYNLPDGNYYYFDGHGSEERHSTVNIQNGFITRVECYGAPDLPYMVWHFERDPWRIYREWPSQNIPREEQPFDMKRQRENCGLQ